MTTPELEELAHRLRRRQHGPSDLLRWSLTRRPSRWPRRVAQEVLESVPEPEDPAEIGWLTVGHSTVLLRLGTRHLLFDPIWSERCSPIQWAGPRRVRPPALRFEGLPEIDEVLISHSHYDHCDRGTLERLAQEHDPRFVVGRGLGEVLSGWGISNVLEVDWWSRTPLWNGGALWDGTASSADRTGESLELEFLPTLHFSARGVRDHNRTLWGAFRLHWNPGASAASAGSEPRARTILFAGDTGYDEELFARLGEGPAPDLAFLPIGAYAPRWFMSKVHVDPAEAVALHRALGSRRSVAVHCATFQLTDEPIDEPERLLEVERRRAALPAGSFEGPHFGDWRTLDDG